MAKLIVSLLLYMLMEILTSSKMTLAGKRLRLVWVRPASYVICGNSGLLYGREAVWRRLIHLEAICLLSHEVSSQPNPTIIRYHHSLVGGQTICSLSMFVEIELTNIDLKMHILLLHSQQKLYCLLSLARNAPFIRPFYIAQNKNFNFTHHIDLAKILSLSLWVF